ncbi:kinesin-like protein KIN-8B isoform X2 [Phalaenopsis equestris]|nr:kinesin-like protein KIN-8B isoform X2 [Phalaenopsis equestris]XP_020582345.1 kinesin-like protein KIN-8B isoform X2 [Phalaenopsis equestris]
MIEEAISSNGNKTYLHILSQYRLLGMANTELQFEIAMRDQVIHNQREAQRNLWNMLLGSGLGQKQMLDLAGKQGITIENWAISASGSLNNRPSMPMPCVLQHHQDISSSAFMHTICQQEHHSSYYVLSANHSTPAFSGVRCSFIPGKLDPNACVFCSSIRTRAFLCREDGFLSPLCGEGLGQQSE